MNKWRGARKLVYLLQLEEYDLGRVRRWMGGHDLDKLEERKGKVRWSGRGVMSFLAWLSLGWWGLVGVERLFEGLHKVIYGLTWVKVRILKVIKPIKVVVITGSLGKTSLKEWLAFSLAEAGVAVEKTPGNVNTVVGVSWWLLRRVWGGEVWVVEAGAYGLGEVEEISRLVGVDVGVVTAVSWPHIERFGSLVRTRKAKMEVVAEAKRRGGWGVFPAKNHQVIDFKQAIRQVGEWVTGRKRGWDEVMAAFKGVEHRLELKKLNRQVWLIDDAYNSNPLGFERALKKLVRVGKGRQKILVTPGMIELGRKQREINRQIARRVREVAEIVVVTGRVNRKAWQEGLGERGKWFYLDNGTDWMAVLRKMMRPPTVILVENDLPDHYF